MLWYTVKQISYTKNKFENTETKTSLREKLKNKGDENSKKAQDVYLFGVALQRIFAVRRFLVGIKAG
jgi:hypothetical protein